MPGKAKLRYLPAAQEDLLSILDFIAKDSPRRAVSVVDKLDGRIGHLNIILSWDGYLDILSSVNSDIVS